MNKKQLIINLIAGIVSFIANLFISFFITPYIVDKVGIEAYGFVSLSNNFINYAQLLTIALSSMSARYIAISIHKGNLDEANKYFTSLFIANLVLSLFLLFPAVFLILKIDYVINVPPAILSDVQILMLFLFSNFLINLINSNYTIGVFVKNKLYLNSFRTIEASLIKIIILFALFYFFKAKITYLGIAALVYGLYLTCFNIYYTRKFIPEILIKKRFFEFKKVIEVFIAGIWNTVTKLGTTLLDGLDLLIVNLFIGSTAMGILALAKTIPMTIQTLTSTLVSVFQPVLVKNYAEGDNKAFISNIKESINIMSIIVNLPIALLFVFGKEIFSLWIPSQDAQLLHILSIMIICSLVINGGINCIYSIFTITNKLKYNSLLILISGIVSSLTVIILLKTTNWGLFAIAGVSTLINILRNLIFTLPYACKCIKTKWTAFYPEVLKSVLSIFILFAVGTLFKSFFEIDNWLMLFVFMAVTSVVGFFINIFIILNRQERKKIITIIKDKIRR